MYNVSFKREGSKLCFDIPSNRTHALHALLASDELLSEREFLTQQSVAKNSTAIHFWSSEAAEVAEKVLIERNKSYEQHRKALIETLRMHNLKITEVYRNPNSKGESIALGVDAKEYEIVRSNVSVGIKFQKPWTSGAPVPLLPDFMRFH